MLQASSFVLLFSEIGASANVSSNKPWCRAGLRTADACCSLNCPQCDDALVCKERSEHGQSCCRTTAVKAGLCATTDDTGCIIPGANAAAAQFCFALHYRHKCKLPKNVHDNDFSELTQCITEEMADYASRRGMSRHQLTHEATAACLTKSWWPTLAESREASANVQQRLRLLERRRAACMSTGPAIWLVTMIKDQSRVLPYWLAWHFLLGASRILVYDHGSQRADALEKICQPWIERGLVTVVKWSRQEYGVQDHAYNHGLRQAVNAGVEFVGAIDADEYLLPFSDRCLPKLLANCTVEAGCGGVQLNRRFTRGAGILSGRPKRSPLQLTMHQIATVEGEVKSIVRAKAAIEYWTPHAALLRRPFCMMDESVNSCRSRPRPERQHSLIFRWPPTTVRAALYHAQCVTLVDWVLKKSLQGWPSNHEKGLFRTLPATVQDYRKNCRPLPTNASRHDPIVRQPAQCRDWGCTAIDAYQDSELQKGLGGFLREQDALALAALGASKDEMPDR